MARTDPQFNLRLPQLLKNRIDEAAQTNTRSINSEIVARLEKSFEEGASQIVNNLSEMLNQTRENMLKTIELQDFYKQAVANFQEKAVILEAEMSEMLKLKNRYQMAVELLESDK